MTVFSDAGFHLGAYDHLLRKHLEKSVTLVSEESSALKAKCSHLLCLCDNSEIGLQEALGTCEAQGSLLNQFFRHMVDRNVK